MAEIYRITNKINGKAYIGQTYDLKRRWRQHKRKTNEGIISRSIQKYGIDNFHFEVILSSDDYPLLLESEMLNIAEQHCIKSFNTIAPNGYNLTTGGGGGKLSDETRKKISKATKGSKNPFYGKNHSEETLQKLKGREVSGETRQKMSSARKGKPLSKDTRLKLSEKFSGSKNPNYGKKHSDETLKKISESLVGKKHSAESRQKMSEARKGRRVSRETRQRMSEAQRGAKHAFYGKNHSEESRQKISESLKGRKHSEESRRKISEAKKGKKLQNIKRSEGYYHAQAIFNDFPLGWSLTKKRDELKKLTGKGSSTVWRWVKEWESKVKNALPSLKEV